MRNARTSPRAEAVKTTLNLAPEIREKLREFAAARKLPVSHVVEALVIEASEWIQLTLKLDPTTHDALIQSARSAGVPVDAHVAALVREQLTGA